MSGADELSLWTVYDHPLDFPDHFVARRWVISAAGEQPTGQVIAGDTLDAVRELLPAFLVRLPRQQNDDPTIVEVWI